MQNPRTAFCASFPVLTSRTQTNSITQRTSRLAVHTRRPAVVVPSRSVVQAQIGGNIEDMPAERIPSEVSEIPEHWERAGLYGIYSSEGVLQYVASTENVGENVRNHLRYVRDSERCHSIRMITVDSVEEAPLAQLAEQWVMTHGYQGPGFPPGNSDEAPEWREEYSFKPDVYIDMDTPAEYVGAEIKHLLRKHKVVLFMKGTREEPRCGYSLATLETLERVAGGDEFVCVDCLDEEKNPGLRQGIKNYSQWPTIPQLYVNGDFVGGCDIVTGMETSGELVTLIGKALGRKPASATVKE